MAPSPEPSTSPASGHTSLENNNDNNNNDNAAPPPPHQSKPVPVIPLAADGRPLTNLSRHAVTAEMVFAPIPNRPYHEAFMRKAIEMAEMALANDETPVGCVFVRDGEVIGRGINGTNASLCVSFF